MKIDFDYIDSQLVEYTEAYVFVRPSYTEAQKNSFLTAIQNQYPEPEFLVTVDGDGDICVLADGAES